MFVPLRALRFHAQSSIAQEAFPQSAWCLLAPEELRGTESRRWVLHPRNHNGEAGLKTELQRVRALAEARIKAGNVPDWSWPQHVQLIEAVDAMLHDISMAESAMHARRYAGAQLRLVTDNPGRRKTGSMQ